MDGGGRVANGVNHNSFFLNKEMVGKHPHLRSKLAATEDGQ